MAGLVHRCEAIIWENMIQNWVIWDDFVKDYSCQKFLFFPHVSSEFDKLVLMKGFETEAIRSKITFPQINFSRADWPVAHRKVKT